MPWMVSIGFYGNDRAWNHHCSGSLIEEDFVLTSASCFDSKPVQAQLKLRFGTANLKVPEEGFMERDILEVILHPKYQTSKTYYDVALVKMTKRVEFTDHVHSICLPTFPVDDEEYLIDKFVASVGWTFSSETSKEELKINSYRVSFNLLKLKLLTISNYFFHQG